MIQLPLCPRLFDLHKAKYQSLSASLVILKNMGKIGWYLVTTKWSKRETVFAISINDRNATNGNREISTANNQMPTRRDITGTVHPKALHGFFTVIKAVKTTLTDTGKCTVWIDHNDVIKWNHVPRYWPFVRGIHRSAGNSSHKGQWRGALMFSLICAWRNGWVNNREVGDLRRYRVHHDVIVILRTCNITATNNAKLILVKVYEMCCWCMSANYSVDRVCAAKTIWIYEYSGWRVYLFF